MTVAGVPGRIAAREHMGWLVDRITDRRARIIGTTVREKAACWWVTFQPDIDRTDINERRAVDQDAPTCGVDLGVKTFAVIADDTGTMEEVHAPRPLRTALRKLRKANMALARTKRDSANRAEAREAVARIHLRVAHRRADFLRQLTTRLARTKRAIAVESLNVAGMARNRRLARAVSDLGFAEFVRQLGYKAQWYGSKVWAADRWFPSSKLCGVCARVNRDLTLADRHWSCPCGAVHDRDRNAAGNLLAAMHLDM